MFNMIHSSFKNIIDGRFFANPVEGAIHGAIATRVTSSLFTAAAGLIGSDYGANPEYSLSVSVCTFAAAIFGAAAGMYNQYPQLQKNTQGALAEHQG